MPGISQALIAKYDVNVPRYTSYPTAVQFHDGADGDVVRSWLEALDPEEPLSLYFHIPFCASMCWFCACNTKVVARYEPVAEYLTTLEREIDLVASMVPARASVSHIHWGGGSPTMVQPDDFRRLMDHIRARFDVLDDAEIAVELDPRVTERAHVKALAESGVNRTSFGVQDFDESVQAAINRYQSWGSTAYIVNAFRDAGVPAVNIDLIYGLPYQTAPSIRSTADRSADLLPDRIAIFGYAHVPWMKKHQRLISEGSLPGGDARLCQFETASRVFSDRGYRAIGLDHFALPGDPLVAALDAGTIHRNFQGYTADRAPALIGMGATGISSTRYGHAQNASDVGTWSSMIAAGGLATARGVELTRADRYRGAIIEKLMCYGQVDLDAIGDEYDLPSDAFEAELALLNAMSSDGLVALEGASVQVTDVGRRLIRAVCSVFDEYFEGGEGRHSRAL